MALRLLKKSPSKKELTTSKAGEYNEDSVSYFKTELLKIRAKPQMYIGPTDDHGIFSILREVLDNSVDEARAGRNDTINIVIGKNDFWVSDSGVGIPVGKHKEAKISTLTHVVSALQASGKMKGNAYTSAIGTHGVGIKCTNALSTEFDIWTYRKADGGWHSTHFKKGVEKVGVKKVQAPKMPEFGKPSKGTVVHFVPDAEVFGKAKLNKDLVLRWCELTSYMNPGLRITLITPSGKKKVWFSKNGIKDYFDKRVTELNATTLNRKPVFHTSQTMEFAIGFADVEGAQVEFFTNTVRNVDQGVHADAFYKALAASLKPYKGKLEYTPSDLQDGLLGLFNYKINAPQFSSQTKEKLVDTRVAEPCFKEALEFFEAYFKENKTLAKNLVQRAATLRKKTSEFLKSKKLIKNVKAAKAKLPAKLADVDSNVPIEQRELYLVEGDSAGGCFTQDTPVLLADGSTVSFGEMVERSNRGDQFQGIGFNLDTKEFEKFDFVEPHLTKHTTELMEITLSDGSKFRCTLDHKWLLADGRYVEAQDLKPEDLLMVVGRGIPD